MRSLFNLFYPKTCKACDTALDYGEDIICTSCRHKLPVTGFHYVTEEPIQKLLYGRTAITLGTALFYFEKKTLVQNLIHNLKYRGDKSISAFLGRWLGRELAEVETYTSIDCVVPVPLHPGRMRKRGYNQVAGFGKEIAKSLDAQYIDNILIRTRATRTQVFMGRSSRSKDVLQSFDIKNKEALKGKHILLVDDLITTGGTIEGCCLALNQTPNIEISVAVMAIAQ